MPRTWVTDTKILYKYLQQTKSTKMRERERATRLQVPAPIAMTVRKTDVKIRSAGEGLSE